MLLLLVVGNTESIVLGVASSGVIFISSFVKISRLFETLTRGLKHTYT